MPPPHPHLAWAAFTPRLLRATWNAFAVGDVEAAGPFHPIHSMLRKKRAGVDAAARAGGRGAEHVLVDTHRADRSIHSRRRDGLSSGGDYDPQQHDQHTSSDQQAGMYQSSSASSQFVTTHEAPRMRYSAIAPALGASSVVSTPFPSLMDLAPGPPVTTSPRSASFRAPPHAPPVRERSSLEPASRPTSPACALLGANGRMRQDGTTRQPALHGLSTSKGICRYWGRGTSLTSAETCRSLVTDRAQDLDVSPPSIP